MREKENYINQTSLWEKNKICVKFMQIVPLDIQHRILISLEAEDRQLLDVQWRIKKRVRKFERSKGGATDNSKIKNSKTSKPRSSEEEDSRCFGLKILTSRAISLPLRLFVDVDPESTRTRDERETVNRLRVRSDRTSDEALWNTMKQDTGIRCPDDRVLCEMAFCRRYEGGAARTRVVDLL